MSSVNMISMKMKDDIDNHSGLFFALVVLNVVSSSDLIFRYAWRYEMNDKNLYSQIVEHAVHLSLSVATRCAYRASLSVTVTMTVAIILMKTMSIVRVLYATHHSVSDAPIRGFA